MIAIYSALLAVGLVVSSPWWVARMLTTERYREGLRERLGGVPARLRKAGRGFGGRVVWVHAVSVGEVLAASRLVEELEAGLGAGGEAWRVVVSTTTRTGQALARERFGADRVFYFPLDFAWAVRRYLRALRPAALVLMESELWPRMLWECERAGVPVVVVNARVSDRSFARAMRVRALWGRVLRRVSLWLVQSEEDARRLVAMGAHTESVRAIGNLKYDAEAPPKNRIAEQIQAWAEGRQIIVAGSTCSGMDGRLIVDEEEYVFGACYDAVRARQEAFLVVAPRHPERFEDAESKILTLWYRRASGAKAKNLEEEHRVEAVLLDTIGDLAAVYAIADIAFIGGSLVGKGGHNPLEPARFGVPVVMGPSFENFREIVAKMQAADAIRIVGGSGDAGLSTAAPLREASGRDDRVGERRSDVGRDDSAVARELERAFVELLTDREMARSMGERGRRVFEEQQGATKRAVEAIVAVIHGAKR